MKKSILAKVLAATLAVTAVLPGAMTVNAAKIVTTSTGTNVETSGTWSPELGAQNIGGQETWHLKSSSANNNINEDYAAETAPAVILAAGNDMTMEAGVDKTISVDLYPNRSLANMRFGIMVKYVDSTHWAFLNYDISRWLLQYQCGDLTGWPDIAGLTNLEDNKFANVKIEYLESGSVKVNVTPEGSEEAEGVEISGDAADALSALDIYAATAGEDGTAAPIRMGFKAGSYGDPVQLTDMNIRNMTIGGQEVAFDSFTWVREREGQLFETGDMVGGTDYAEVAAGTTATSSDVTDFAEGTLSAVVRPQANNAAFALGAGDVKVGFDGSKWYYAVGEQTTQVNVGPALAQDTDYTISATVNNGKLTASVTPAGGDAVALAADVSCAGAQAGSLSMTAGAGAALLVRNVNYEKVSKADPTELQAEYDRVVAAKGAENTENKYYSDTWTAYGEALSAAKTVLDDEEAELTTSQANTLKTNLTTTSNRLVLVDKTALQSKYDELKTVEKGMSTDASWTEFTNTLAAAKAVLDKIDKKESVTSTEVNAQVTALNGAKDKLVERAATTEEKAGLQAAYGAASALVKGDYTEESWAAFADALAAVENALNSATATNADVAKALEDLNTAKAALVAAPAGSAEKASLNSAVAAAGAVKNDNYTAESWAAFQNALKAAQAVAAKGDAATRVEVNAAVKALNDAKAALKKAGLAVGDTFKAGSVTYKVTKGNTVAVAGATGAKLNIPATVKQNGVTYKVTSVAAGAIQKNAKLKSVTVGANVTSIGKKAFFNCKKLATVTFKAKKAPKIAKQAFKGVKANVKINYPKKMAAKEVKKLKKAMKSAGVGKKAVYKKK